VCGVLVWGLRAWACASVCFLEKCPDTRDGSQRRVHIQRWQGRQRHRYVCRILPALTLEAMRALLDDSPPSPVLFPRCFSARGVSACVRIRDGSPVHRCSIWRAGAIYIAARLEWGLRRAHGSLAAAPIVWHLLGAGMVPERLDPVPARAQPIATPQARLTPTSQGGPAITPGDVALKTLRFGACPAMRWWRSLIFFSPNWLGSSYQWRPGNGSPDVSLTAADVHRRLCRRCGAAAVKAAT